MPKQIQNDWSHFILGIAANSALYPLDYAKTLVQIGHEPIPPKQSKSYFGEPVLVLPNMFEYVNFIRMQDGIVGCYKGLSPRFCGHVLNIYVSQIFIEYLEPDKGDESLNDTLKRNKYFRKVKNDTVALTAAIVITHPFSVISTRMIAQFVGKETKYNGIFISIKEIYRHDGSMGFFSGLIPRLIGEVLCFVLASSLTFVTNHYVYLLSSYLLTKVNNHYVIEEDDVQIITFGMMYFLIGNFTYPFHVISNCMIVTNSCLKAGSPPLMPHYRNWIECGKDLFYRGQLNRGSGAFSRYYINNL